MSEKKTIEIRDSEEPLPAENEIPENGDTAIPDESEKEIGLETESEDISEKLEVAQKEAEASYDRFLRATAELENCKKRHQREIADFRKFANQSLIKDLLPIIDNLERAIQSTENNITENQCIVEGVELTHREIIKVLEGYGVEPVESIGKAFDPAYHEAVSQQPSDDHPDNTVLHELQKGYLLHDRLIRPAMVVVSKREAPEDTADDEPSAAVDTE